MIKTTRFICAALTAMALGNGAALSASVVTKQEINAGSFSGKDAEQGGAGTVSPLVLKVQILLDRAGMSPGVTDGRDGDNFRAAIRSFKRKTTASLDGRLDSDLWTKLTDASTHDVVTDYALTEEGLAQNHIETIPDENFKQGDNDSVLTIPPGPNGPVGSVWIDLSKPKYGIHGTAEQAEIGKTESDRCVRLTNRDAAELAKAVSKGTLVEFLPGT